jgi:hypothetical protein
MDVDFEILGQITGHETIAIGNSIREFRSCGRASDTAAGGSGRGLPTYVSLMVRYGLPKFTGTKRTASVK